MTPSMSTSTSHAMMILLFVSVADDGLGMDEETVSRYLMVKVLSRRDSSGRNRGTVLPLRT